MTGGQPSVKRGLAERDSGNYGSEQHSGRERISAEVAVGKRSTDKTFHCGLLIETGNGEAN